MNNKGQLGNLQGIILTLVVVGVLLGAGFFILGTFAEEINARNDYTNGTTFLAVNNTIGAMENIPNLLPLVVIIAMVVIILALVFTIPGARGG